MQEKSERLEVTRPVLPLVMGDFNAHTGVPSRARTFSIYRCERQTLPLTINPTPPPMYKLGQLSWKCWLRRDS